MREREYDIDFALWSERQDEALPQRAGNEIDWEKIAEEIRKLGPQRQAGNPQPARGHLRVFAQVAIPDRCTFEQLAQLDRHDTR